MVDRIINMIRKHDGLVVSLVLVITYFSIILSFDYLQNESNTMFATPDSHSYRNVADWLIGVENTNSTIMRPFFYPLMLNLFRSFAGIFGIWYFQILLWVFSGVILYKAIYKATANIVLAIAGGIIYAGNLTLMLLTLHALTEIVTTFLIVVLIFVIIDKQKYQTDHYWLLIIFIIVLLTVTKPVYSTLLLAVLAYRIPALILNIIKGRSSYKLLVYFALILLPLLIQLSIMKVKHDEYIISEIGIQTIRYYYFAEVFRQVNDVSLNEARVYVYESSIDKKEMLKFLLMHNQASIRTYFSILGRNLLSGSNFVNYPANQIYLYSYMVIINKLYFLLHVFMMPYSVVVLIVLFKKKRWVDVQMIFSILFPIGIIILSSGITFDQGDRIILPSLPLWIALYAVALARGRNLTRENPRTVSPAEA